MKRKQIKRDNIRDEYIFDYSKAVRGKHFQRLMKEGANVIVLEPDVARAFRGSAAVNDALRIVASSLQNYASTNFKVKSDRSDACRWVDDAKKILEPL